MNGKIGLFKNFPKFSYMSARTCKELPKGIEYYGFTYYPRRENFKDPPYEPSKLFLVRRIKQMKGTNFEEKHALKTLNLNGDKKLNGHRNVVKNTAYTNALLWKVKHLVEIKPITVEGELPKDGDFSGTYLRDTGKFIVSPKLKISSEEMEFSEKYFKDKKKWLGRAYIKDFLKKKWLDGYSGSV